MTGYDIYKKVCLLLGYDGDENTHTNTKAESMTEIINRIATDLQAEEIENLSCSVTLGKSKEDALIYGCAMLLAVTLNDAGHARLFSELYNAKRGAALKQSGTRFDVLPVPPNGGS